MALQGLTESKQGVGEERGMRREVEMRKLLQKVFKVREGRSYEYEEVEG